MISFDSLEKKSHEGPDCTKCGEMIIGKIAYASDKPYHDDCFTCAECKKPLAGQQFTRKEDKILCLGDYYSLYSPKCHNCKAAIKSECVTLKQKDGVPTRKYHPQHFLCIGCGATIGKNPFKVDLDGDPFCLKCFGSRKM